MKTDHLQRAVRGYLVLRRQLGFDLSISGQQLLAFARFADVRAHRGPLSMALQLAWIHAATRATPLTWTRRLEILRPFARYYQQFEPATPVLDRELFGRGHRRRLTPHIYTDAEIQALVQAASALTPIGGLRPATYATLFGLLAATGLRLSEALQLRDADIDLAQRALRVRETKFKKSRRLPLHATTLAALRRYRTRRVAMGAAGPPDGPFFVSRTGGALPKPTVHGIFVGLRTRLGWIARGEHPSPRLHDLRHTFAVQCVERWQREGVASEQGVFWLSTYLGHASVSDTYWYLTATPGLLGSAAAPFERFAGASRRCHTLERSHA